MNCLRYVIVFLLGAAGLFGSSGAWASTDCSATMLEMDFNASDPTARNTTSTITYSCDTNGNNKEQISVNLCIAIGSPIRQLVDASGETLAFQIYKDGGRSQIWGDESSRTFLQLPTFSYATPTGSGKSEPMTVVAYGTITDPGLATAAPVTYNQLLQPRLIYTYKAGDTEPHPCDHNQSSQTTFDLNAEVKVPGRCSVLTATDMDFGTIYDSASTGNLASTSFISLECADRTAWQVGLSSGANDIDDDGTRRLCNAGGTCIRYQLNRPPSYGGGRWGNTLDDDTVADSSAGSRQTLTVHGVISDEQLTEAGDYSDIVTVTLTY